MADVIVIGARVAGSATAMLLARRGLKVIAVDQAAFPSDTLSTHQVQVPGVARLQRWGLLNGLRAAGTPGAHTARFEAGAFVLHGAFPNHEGADAVYSPRRTLLDLDLVKAARAAGVEVREKYVAEELVFDGDRVVGVRGRTKGGPSSTELATIVVGADGKHSMVAKSVHAPITYERPALTAGAYAYWDGVPLTGGELYTLPGCSVGAWPTNDGHVLTFVSWPRARFSEVRSNLEASLLRALDSAGDLGQRVRSSRRVEHVRATIDTPNRIRRPHGAGWALIGDAGMVVDPITGQGISDAFMQAELMADAITNGLDGRARLDDALAFYEAERDRRLRPMFDFTVDLARHKPLSIESRMLFAALQGRPAEIERFLGVITGSVPMEEYFAPASLMKVMGPRRMLRILASRLVTNRARHEAAAVDRAMA
jgi:flavin-dependent dehydrogenase